MSKNACLGMVLATAALLACGTRVTYSQLNTPPAQMIPRHAAGVQVFTTGAPSQSFVEVGLLEAQQESAYSNDRQPQILQALRERAAEVGCDGIILLGSNDSVVGSVSGGMGWTTTLAGYRATCIMFYQPWSGGSQQPAPTYPVPPTPPPPTPPVPSYPSQPAAGGCTRDRDCPENGICEGGVCIPDPSAPQPQVVPCTRDVDCPGNAICESGVCVAG